MGKVGTRKRGKTWQYYFQLASVDGTRKWKTGSGYRTKAEAQAAGKAKNCTLISEEWDFHSLRHTHATILYEAGVPMPLIQKRLGHINIQTTKRYTNHVTKKMLSMLDEVINGDNIDNNLE